MGKHSDEVKSRTSLTTMASALWRIPADHLRMENEGKCDVYLASDPCYLYLLETNNIVFQISTDAMESKF